MSLTKRKRLGGRREKQIWPKVRHCLTRPRPPPPPSKVRHIFKKYFYCLFELYSLCLLFGDELVFFPPKNPKKKLRVISRALSPRGNLSSEAVVTRLLQKKEKCHNRPGNLLMNPLRKIGELKTTFIIRLILPFIIKKKFQILLKLTKTNKHVCTRLSLSPL